MRKQKVGKIVWRSWLREKTAYGSRTSRKKIKNTGMRCSWLGVVCHQTCSNEERCCGKMCWLNTEATRSGGEFPKADTTATSSTMAWLRLSWWGTRRYWPYYSRFPARSAEGWSNVSSVVLCVSNRVVRLLRLGCFLMLFCTPHCCTNTQQFSFIQIQGISGRTISVKYKWVKLTL